MGEASEQRRVLVTGGRFMPSTGVVHALRRVGARIDVVDSVGFAPALHARGIVAHITAPPAKDPVGFVKDVAAIARDRNIDMIFAPFEEGFYLSRYREMLPAPLLVPDFEVLEKLHNKASFATLCADLCLHIPQTEIVTSQPALRSAIGRFDEYFARPAFGRGGHLAISSHHLDHGEPSIEDCQPSEQCPWLVQSFVEGDDTCIFALARSGKIQLVGVYEPTIATSTGFSVRFTTIDEPAAVDIATTICGHLGYTGLIGFDYRRTADGPVLLECNPRTTAGFFLCDEDLFGRALLDDLSELRVVPAGRSEQYDCYLVDAGLTDLSVPERLEALLFAPDALISHLDFLPFIYSFVARWKITREALRRHISLYEASIGDTIWDGEALPNEHNGNDA